MSCLFSKGQEEGGAAESEDPTQVAILKLPDGKEHQIKVLKPTHGDDLFLDIRDLHRATGYFSFDPGFTCTGSCLSGITFIDGPKGVCLYRGFAVPELVETAEALEARLVHEKVKAMFSNFTINAHPMAIMAQDATIRSIQTELAALTQASEQRTNEIQQKLGQVDQTQQIQQRDFQQALHQVRSDLDTTLTTNLKQHSSNMDTKFDELKQLVLAMNKRGKPAKQEDEDMTG
eukprot:Skav204128  [mRNA]  locus=scaffold2473:84056:102616:+ [translate_table: standard]